MFFTEDTFEQAVIELFEGMGYTHIYAPDMNRTDYSSPLLDSVLQDSLVRINKGLPLEAIQEAITKLKTFESGSLVQKNMAFMDYLQNGITVLYICWIITTSAATLSMSSISSPSSRTALTSDRTSSCLSTVCHWC